MRTVSLGELNRYSGSTVNPLQYSDEVFELYSVPSYESQYPEIIKGENIGSSKVTVEPGDILICKINPRINRVWVVTHNTQYRLLASSEWIVVRSPENNADYLRHYFKSKRFQTMMVSQVTGIGGSLTRAQPKQVATYLVPLPDRGTQDRIADILNHIERIVALRTEQLSSIDEMVKSRFIEMFGDADSSDWRTMEEICSIITDGTHQPPKFVSEGIPFLFVSNITGNMLTYNAEKFIDEQTYNELIKRTPIEIGDILLSTVGSYGHPAVVKEPTRFCFQRHIAYLKPKADMVDSDYLHGAILSSIVQAQIEEKVKGIAQKTLNLSEIRTIRVPVPEMHMQRAFAHFAAEIDKSKYSAEMEVAA